MRVGNFTSSEIWKLTTRDRSGKGFGKSALTYIEEKSDEILTGRSMSQNSGARETAWGTFVEKIAFTKLPLNYRLTSSDRYKHESISNWSGMPDILYENCVGDIKCPFTVKSYMNLYKINSIESFKERTDDYYWQLVSNAILTDSDFSELIIYCPYKSELDEIREMANSYDDDQNQIAFINWATDEQLPYLPDGGLIKNLKIIKFEVPNEDKEFLIESVSMAIPKLIATVENFKTTINAGLIY
jgi:hypothetical protein